MAKIVLTDDHVLLRNGLAALVIKLDHNVLFEANNGCDFIGKLDQKNLPDLVLLDIHMQEMDGFETAKWIKTHHPEIKVLVLSMYDNESAIIRMIQNGARGYILKDSEPEELRIAINAVLTKGYYYSELVSGKLIKAINNIDEAGSNINLIVKLNERETNFLKYVCTELHYKEIADKMFVSPRTIDGYRDELFKKLQVRTRVGLAIYAIKNGLVQL